MKDKICRKCGEDFKPQKGLINYCSLQCRNSRTWSIDDKKKKSDSAKKSNKVKLSLEKAHSIESTAKMIETKKKKREYINNIFDKIRVKRKLSRKEKIISLDYSELSYERLRDRIFYEQNGKCNKCELDKWNGEDIPLELEHKDGDNKNNLRENLEGLCPNCHAQTDTWRGRNRKNNKDKVDDVELFNALIEYDWNMRQSLLSVGLAAKGGNYNRCHKLKREYGEIVHLEGTAPSSSC